MARSKAFIRILTVLLALLFTLALCASVALGSEPSQDAPPTLMGGGRGQIVFVSNRDSGDNIYLMDADGSNVQRLTTSPSYGFNWSPRWSPDGEQIAFASNQGGWHIYTMNADGSEMLQLTLPDNLFWAPAIFDKDPDWSPDGAFVAFDSNRDDSENIYVINVNKGFVHPVTFGRGEHLFPAWSPDQQFIVYSLMTDYDQPGLQMDIYLKAVNAPGKGVNLTRRPGFYASPTWSPDGKQILFASDRDGNSDIYTMNVDGSNVRRLTNLLANEYSPAWSPDGSQIAFASNRGGDYDIYVMDADGSNVRRITDDPADDKSPAWRP